MRHIKIFCSKLLPGVSDLSHLSATTTPYAILLFAIVLWLLSGACNAIAADTSPDSVPSNGIERVDIDCPTYDFYKYSGKDTLSNKIDEIIFYDNYSCLIKSRSEIARDIYSLTKGKKFKSLDEAEKYLPRLYKSRKNSSIVINPYYTPCVKSDNLIQCESNIIIGYCKKNSPSEFDGHYCALDQRTFTFYLYMGADNNFYIDEVRSLIGDNDLASRYTRLRGAPK